MLRAGKIYLRDGDKLIPLEESVYEAEEILQKLLADYPDLLAGDQMQPDEPRRWLLITREAGVPGVEGGSSRWSLDHLFVDQDGIPTLVEVKRSTNSQIRREVVGQMLDYAANVAAYWGPGQIRLLFEERCRLEGKDPDQELSTFLQLSDPEVDADEGFLATTRDGFWQRASDSLAARRLRLVFVADVIASELQRIIEFLNESMARTEVLGVEVRQFVGAGRQTLVPRVIGQTAAAEDLKRPTVKTARVDRTWTEDLFVEAGANEGGQKVAQFLRDTIRWSREHGLALALGKGKYGPLYIRTNDAAGAEVPLVATSTGGHSQVSFVTVKQSPPFDRQDARLEWCRRLNAVPGVSIDEGYAIRATWPTVRFDAMPSEEARLQFLEAIRWAAEQLQRPPNIGLDTEGQAAS